MSLEPPRAKDGRGLYPHLLGVAAPALSLGYLPSLSLTRRLASTAAASTAECAASSLILRVS
jgi:hypothetical protein